MTPLKFLMLIYYSRVANKTKAISILLISVFNKGLKNNVHKQQNEQDVIKESQNPKIDDLLKYEIFYVVLILYCSSILSIEISEWIGYNGRMAILQPGVEYHNVHF